MQRADLAATAMTATPAHSAAFAYKLA